MPSCTQTLSSKLQKSLTNFAFSGIFKNISTQFNKPHLCSCFGFCSNSLSILITKSRSSSYIFFIYTVADGAYSLAHKKFSWNYLLLRSVLNSRKLLKSRSLSCQSSLKTKKLHQVSNNFTSTLKNTLRQATVLLTFLICCYYCYCEFCSSINCRIWVFSIPNLVNFSRIQLIIQSNSIF